jgi:3-oxoadipate CoA-transferase beta subunit
VSAALTQEQVAREVGLELLDGWYVNLGIGLPSSVVEHLPAGREVVIHCENGMLGMGPPAEPGTEDPNLVDAGKRPVTLVAGGAYMTHSDSFAIIRCGHLDACVLGAYEVGANGDLANWSLGGSTVPAVGGAMDLAVGARAVWVMSRHTNSRDRPKLVHRTRLPITAAGVVSRVYTDLGIFVPDGDGFTALALVAGIDPDVMAARTEARLTISTGCRTLPSPAGNLDRGGSRA